MEVLMNKGREAVGCTKRRGRICTVWKAADIQQAKHTVVDPHGQFYEQITQDFFACSCDEDKEPKTAKTNRKNRLLIGVNKLM